MNPMNKYAIAPKDSCGHRQHFIRKRISCDKLFCTAPQPYIAFPLIFLLNDNEATQVSCFETMYGSKQNRRL